MKIPRTVSQATMVNITTGHPNCNPFDHIKCAIIEMQLGYWRLV
jgi:hypothetical protein